MSRRKRGRTGTWIGLAVLIAALTGLVVAVRSAQQVPDQPQPVAWDREPCAHCHMLIGDPAYAAQLVTDEGRVYDFDDPGCLMSFIEDRHPDVHRIWLHHMTDDRWLSPEQVGFVPATTPMGFGLAAVDRDVAGALDWGAARARLLHVTADAGEAVRP